MRLEFGVRLGVRSGVARANREGHLAEITGRIADFPAAISVECAANDLGLTARFHDGNESRSRGAHVRDQRAAYLRVDVLGVLYVVTYVYAYVFECIAIMALFGGLITGLITGRAMFKRLLGRSRRVRPRPVRRAFAPDGVRA